MEMIMQIFKEDAELQALLRTVLEGICSDFTDEAYSLELLEEKFHSFARPGMEEPELWAALVKAAVELTSAQSPKWEMIAARLLGASFRRELSGRLKVLGITDFYSKLCYLTEEKLYWGIHFGTLYKGGDTGGGDVFMSGKGSSVYLFRTGSAA